MPWGHQLRDLRALMQARSTGYSHSLNGRAEVSSHDARSLAHVKVWLLQESMKEQADFELCVHGAMRKAGPKMR